MKKQANCLRCLKYQEIGAKRHSQITGSLPYTGRVIIIRFTVMSGLIGFATR
jgi:hypothetical protein